MAVEASNARKASVFAANNGLAANDSVIGVTTADGSPNNCLVTVQALLSNSSADHVTRAGYDLRVGTTATPTNSTSNSAIVKGTIFWDTDYVYVATANGVTKRSALSTF